MPEIPFCGAYASTKSPDVTQKSAASKTQHKIQQDE